MIFRFDTNTEIKSMHNVQCSNETVLACFSSCFFFFLFYLDSSQSNESGTAEAAAVAVASAFFRFRNFYSFVAVAFYFRYFRIEFDASIVLLSVVTVRQISESQTNDAMHFCTERENEHREQKNIPNDFFFQLRWY